MYVIQDIRSSVNPKIIYAKKGDKLSIIADFTNCYIVELNGNRFSVNKKYLTDDIKSIDTNVGK